MDGQHGYQVTNSILKTYNPQKLKVVIETICGGPVAMAEHQHSGNILVTKKL